MTAWFGEHVPDATAAARRSSLIAGGHSNLTFGVTDAAGNRYVLRRPPLGHVLATAHDMGREHRIISALGPTDVPVPPALGLCTDDDVNGAPFYVMGFVDGHVLRDAKSAEAALDEDAAAPRRRVDRRRPRPRSTPSTSTPSASATSASTRATSPAS